MLTKAHALALYQTVTNHFSTCVDPQRRYEIANSIGPLMYALRCTYGTGARCNPFAALPADAHLPDPVCEAYEQSRRLIVLALQDTLLPEQRDSRRRLQVTPSNPGAGTTAP